MTNYHAPVCFRMNTKPEIKESIKRMTHQLEKQGYVVTSDREAARVFAYQMMVPQRKNKLIFAKQKRKQQMVIAVNPKYKVEINPKLNTIKFKGVA